MKKVHANWYKEISLECDCPYCENYNDITKHFELEDYLGEFDEENLEGVEITCGVCGKKFGLSETING